MKKSLKRGLSFGLSLTFLVTSTLNVGYFLTKESKADDTPDKIEMPIVLYDHMADRIMFERSGASPNYDSNAESSESIAIAGDFGLRNFWLCPGGSTYAGTIEVNHGAVGAVLPTLGENNVPTYSQEEIARLSASLKKYLEIAHYSNNEILKSLENQIVTNGVADLGTYEEAKAKFDNGGKWKDISTCYDYMYYVTSTFWKDTQYDVTKRVDTFNKITLEKDSEGFYTFSSDSNNINKEIIYDAENGNIYNGTNQASGGQGFFPLDYGESTFENNDIKTSGINTQPLGEDLISSDNKYVSKLRADDGKYHNFHFSMKAHCEFTYNEDKNLVFDFSGDDDVYLFINNYLVLDIGGTHGIESASVKLNDIKDQIGLVDGEVYSFDFFYMERNTTGSNIKIKTNMCLREARATSSVIYKDKDGNELKDKENVSAGDKVGLEYTINAGCDDMNDISFKDTKQGVSIGKDGIDLGENGVYVDDKISATIYDKDGNPKQEFTISKDDLNNPEAVRDFCDKINNISLKDGEKLVISGLKKTVEKDEILSSNLEVKVKAPQNVAENGEIIKKDMDVSVEPSNTSVYPKLTPAARVDVEFSTDKPVLRGEAVGIKYTLTTDSDLMKNPGLKDDSIGFEINELGINLSNGTYVKEGESLKLSVIREDGTEEVYELPYEYLNQPDSDEYKNFIKKFGKDELNLNKNDKLVISGLNKNMVEGGITATPVASIDGAEKLSLNANGELVYDYKNLTPSNNASLGELKQYNVTYVSDTNGDLVGDTSEKVNYQENPQHVPTPLPKEGYSFDKWTYVDDGVEKEVDPNEFVVEKDVEFKANFKPNDYPYTVRYVDEDGNPLINEKHGSGKFDTKVNESPVEIEGYIKPDNSAEITITTNVDKNIITFVYKKIEVTTTEPETTTQPVPTETSTVAPSTTQPVSTETSTVAQSTTQPVPTETNTVAPSTTQPVPTETSTATTGTTQPGSTETSTVTPGTTQPATTPSATEPEITHPTIVIPTTTPAGTIPTTIGNQQTQTVSATETTTEGKVSVTKVKKNKKSAKKGKVKGQDEKKKTKKDAVLNISGKEVNSRVNSNTDNSNNTDGSQTENSNVKGTTVQTGESNSIFVFIGLFALSIFGLGLLSFRRKYDK
ncbi:fibro-slime domain-containing protein [Eubacterium sp.]